MKKSDIRLFRAIWIGMLGMFAFVGVLVATCVVTVAASGGESSHRIAYLLLGIHSVLVGALVCGVQQALKVWRMRPSEEHKAGLPGPGAVVE